MRKQSWVEILHNHTRNKAGCIITTVHCNLFLKMWLKSACVEIPGVPGSIWNPALYTYSVKWSLHLNSERRRRLSPLNVTVPKDDLFDDPIMVGDPHPRVLLIPYKSFWFSHTLINYITMTVLWVWLYNSTSFFPSSFCDWKLRLPLLYKVGFFHWLLSRIISYYMYITIKQLLVLCNEYLHVLCVWYSRLTTCTNYKDRTGSSCL